MDLPTAVLESTRAVASAYVWAKVVNAVAILTGIFGVIGFIFLAAGALFNRIEKKP